MIAMKTKNITSLKIAWATIGQSLTQAQEVISLANVQLQGAVLSEWFRSLDAGTLFPERSDLTLGDLPQFVITAAHPS